MVGLQPNLTMPYTLDDFTTDKVEIQMPVTDGANGATIYRAGKRIPLPYTLRAADGRVLAEGKLTYG